VHVPQHKTTGKQIILQMTMGYRLQPYHQYVQFIDDTGGDTTKRKSFFMPHCLTHWWSTFRTIKSTSNLTSQLYHTRLFFSNKQTGILLYAYLFIYCIHIVPRTMDSNGYNDRGVRPTWQSKATGSQRDQLLQYSAHHRSESDEIESTSPEVVAQRRMVHRAMQEHKATTASAERSLALAESCMEIGSATLEEVSRQGEALDGVDRGLYIVRPYICVGGCNTIHAVVESVWSMNMNMNDHHASRLMRCVFVIDLVYCYW